MARRSSLRFDGYIRRRSCPSWLLIALVPGACDAPLDDSDAATGAGYGQPEALGSIPASCEDELGRQQAALSVVDRSLVGSPAHYHADPALRQREDELRRSQRARRELAWQIAERVLAPVHLPPGLMPAAARASLPAWQTWHAKDDLTRIFRHLYPELSPAQKAERSAFSAQAITRGWLWNDGAVADFDDWTFERLMAYQEAMDEARELFGLGGIYRVAYAPAASHHWLRSYPDVLACSDPGSIEVPSPSSGPCRRGEVKPACLAGPFPDAAVLVKASWRRADASHPLPVFDTSAEALERRLATRDGFAWGIEDRHANPTDPDIYSLELPNGNAFRLAALHIMTKELDHWFWTTLWWSDRPDEDFGADRPATLPLPWKNYKLCAVTAFEEQDPNPSGDFERSYPSLGRALAATHAGVGGPTWCSNPYLEEGEGNVATNCIGCHQHAGTGLRSEDILGDREQFPEFGRTRQRDDFPSDYVFSGSTGDDLGAMFRETEDHFR